MKTFEIYDDKVSRSLITLHADTELKTGYFEINAAPLQAYENGTEEDYCSKVHFRWYRESWDAAYRIARLIANAHPSLIAKLDDDDVSLCLQIDLAWHLRESYMVASNQRTWIDARKKTPNSNGPVLIFTEGSEDQILARYNIEDQLWSDDMGMVIDPPSRWMSLPNPPSLKS